MSAETNANEVLNYLQAISALDLEQKNNDLYDTYRESLFKKSPAENKATVEKLFPLAEKGDPESQFKLGMHLFMGMGIELDRNKADQFYLKASNQGHADAQYNLGWSYSIRKHEDRENNPIKAFQWFEKAAYNGHCMAQDKLASCYLLGDGVDSDVQKRFLWNLKAARQGLLSAIDNIAGAYKNGSGTDKNLSLAIDWYTVAAEANYQFSQQSLAEIYLSYKEYRQAFNWYLKAANQGSVESMYQVGCLYADGNGVTQDFVEAAKWLSKASEEGNLRAQDRLQNLSKKSSGFFGKFFR